MTISQDLVNQFLTKASELTEGKAIRYSLKASDISYRDLKETVRFLNLRYPKYAFFCYEGSGELFFIVKKLFNQF